MAYISKINTKGVGYSIADTFSSGTTNSLTNLPYKNHLDVTLTGATQFSITPGSMKPGERMIITCHPTTSFKQEINGKTYNIGRKRPFRIYVQCISDGVYSTIVIENNLPGIDLNKSYRNAEFGDIYYKDGTVDSPDNISEHNLDDILGIVVDAYHNNMITNSNKPEIVLRVLYFQPDFFKKEFDGNNWKKRKMYTVSPTIQSGFLGLQVNVDVYTYGTRCQTYKTIYDENINAPIIPDHNQKDSKLIYKHVFNVYDNHLYYNNDDLITGDDIISELGKITIPAASSNIKEMYASKYGETIFDSTEVTLPSVYELKSLGLPSKQTILNKIITNIKSHPNFSSSKYGSTDLNKIYNAILNTEFVSCNISDALGQENTADAYMCKAMNVITYIPKNSTEDNSYDEDLTPYIRSIIRRKFSFLPIFCVNTGIDVSESTGLSITFKLNPITTKLVDTSEMETISTQTMYDFKSHHTYDITAFDTGHKSQSHRYTFESDNNKDDITLRSIPLENKHKPGPTDVASGKYWKTLREAKLGDILTRDGVILDTEQLYNDIGPTGLWTLLNSDYNEDYNQMRLDKFHGGYGLNGDIFGICVKKVNNLDQVERGVFLSFDHIINVLNDENGVPLSSGPTMTIYADPDTIANMKSNTYKMSEDINLKGTRYSDTKIKDRVEINCRVSDPIPNWTSPLVAEYYSGRDFHYVNVTNGYTDSDTPNAYNIPETQCTTLTTAADAMDILSNITGKFNTTDMDENVAKGLLMSINFLKENGVIFREPEIIPADYHGMKEMMWRYHSMKTFWTSSIGTGSYNEPEFQISTAVYIGCANHSGAGYSDQRPNLPAKLFPIIILDSVK